MRCTDICPRNLLGYPIEPHKMVRTAMHAVELNPQMVITASLCCNCGICETLACNQGVSPKAVINEYKAVLAKNKLRYVATDNVEVSKERDYRMIPSTRWESILGVSKFDKIAEYIGENYDFNEVRISTRSHIGAPSVPTVKVGDIVKIGDKIADSNDGLSLPQYATIDGKVTSVSDEIIINKVNYSLVKRV
jgi:Na+-translocating ferredoxin:NAD+ oxidoreductase RnfC subunit